MARENYIQIENPRLIYIGIESLESFELLAIKEEPEVPSAVGWIVRTKIVEQRGVTVLFQYWVRPIRPDFSDDTPPAPIPHWQVDFLR